MRDDPTASPHTKPPTVVADVESSGTGKHRLHPALIAVVAIGLAVLLAWVVAGLPGVGDAQSITVILLVVSGISGGLTLVFVINAIRKARHRARLGTGELLAVVLSGLITGVVSIVQLAQTARQLVQR